METIAICLCILGCVAFIALGPLTELCRDMKSVYPNDPLAQQINEIESCNMDDEDKICLLNKLLKKKKEE